MRVIIGLIALLLVACGGDDKSTASTTTTISTQQVASVVAEYGDPLVTALDQHQDCDSLQCLFGEARYNRYKAMVDLAATFVRELPPVTNMPSEIRVLGERTIERLRDVDTAWTNWNVCLSQHQSNGNSDSSACTTEEGGIEKAVTAVRDVLKGWDPYR